jgi:hypothetical protein
MPFALEKSSESHLTTLGFGMMQSSVVRSLPLRIVFVACWIIGPSVSGALLIQNDQDKIQGLVTRALNANNSNTDNEQHPPLSEADLICKGAKDAYYATDLELEKNPCSCTYNLQTRNLAMECQYEYCPVCNEEMNLCGKRVVKIDTTLTEDDLATFFEQTNATLNIGTSKDYCIQYTEGKFSKGKFICTTIVNSFNTGSCSGDRFGDLPYGLPLLTCTQEAGCRCLDPTQEIDPESPFAGFAVLEFETCYNPNATATTALSTSSSSMRYDIVRFWGIWGIIVSMFAQSFQW